MASVEVGSYGADALRKMTQIYPESRGMRGHSAGGQRHESVSKLLQLSAMKRVGTPAGDLRPVVSWGTVLLTRWAPSK